MSATPTNLLTDWSTVLMVSLADAGIRHLVLSPGSRSTPFVAAAVRARRFQLHDAIDERAASFLALGIARATGAPSALLCTSGSAAAHYYPAVIEASLDLLPLVVVTADRPFELQECGASQTIDQVKLYGGYVRKFFEAGNPEAAPEALTGLRRKVAQIVAASRYPYPGPVHLNVRARKPLEPEEPTSDEGHRLRSAVRALLDAPVISASAPAAVPDPRAIADLADRCAGARRGLLVYGPASLGDAAHRDAVFALARATGFPLLTEAPSQLRLVHAPPGVTVCDRFDAVLGCPAFRQRAIPDLIVQLGSTLTSSAWERYARFDAARTHHVLFSEHSWKDPTHTVSSIIFGDPAETVGALVRDLGTRTVEGADERAEWARLFSGADALAKEAVDEDLASEPRLSEGMAVRTLMGAIPDGSILMLGNSLAIRHVDTFASRRATDVGVLCQRGANGIDGLVAGTAGAARALDRPTVLLIGDVSLLHDISSLGLLAAPSQPVVVVVLNNGGGRIFEQLPLGALAASGDGPLHDIAVETMNHIVTTHDLDLSHAAKLFRVAYAKVDTGAGLQEALEQAFGTRGTTLVEVSLADHGAREQRSRIARRIDDRLGPLLGTR